MTIALPCRICHGEGRERRSRYGGNDPDVADVGPCKACNGSGNQTCEECGERPAIVLYQGYLLCQVCHLDKEMPF